MSLRSEKIIQTLTERIPTDGPAICDKVGAVFLFEVTAGKGGPSKKWTVNVRDKPGSVHEGEVGKFDAHFIITDDDLVKIAQKTVNPQMVFMQGKMKIKGNMAAAMKFTPDLLPSDVKF